MQVTDLEKVLTNLRFAFESQGIPQCKIAEKADISGPYFNRILKRLVPLVSYEILSRLAKAIGLRLSDLDREPREFMLWFDREVLQKRENSRRKELVA